MCIDAQSPITGPNPCYIYYMNGAGLYLAWGIEPALEWNDPPPVERGKKHLFSYTLSYSKYFGEFF